jgi:hypothetical protein
MSCDCQTREVYTIKVDSSNVSTLNSNAASFVAYLPIPLTNVVKMELLSACITPSTNVSPVVYFHVEELISKFINRAEVTYTLGASSNTLTTVGSTSATIANNAKLAEALVAVPVDTSRVALSPVIYTSGGYFSTVVNYINPIRRLDRLTINAYTSTGAYVTTASSPNVPTFLTFRFECAKNNKCLY